MNSGKEKVLIIDDEEAVAKLLAAMMGHAGFEPIISTDSSNFLELCSEYRPGLVICDVCMPGTDGYTIRKRLSELPSSPPVLLMSGYPEPLEPDGNAGQRRGEILAKPFTLSTLMAAVSAALSGPELRASGSNQR